MLDPEKLLGQYGGASGSAGVRAPTAEKPIPKTQPRYCSFCWCVLPADSDACPDCGRTLAEMETARAAIAAADRNWIPPRRRNHQSDGESGVDVASPATGPVAVELRKTRNSFLIGGLVWGAFFLVVAFRTLLISHSAEPAASDPASLKGRPPVSARPPGDVRIVWPESNSEYSAEYNAAPWKGEIRLDLLDQKGAIVSRAARSVSPSQYVIRYRSRHEKAWSQVKEANLLDTGGTCVLKFPPEIVADYYLFHGRRLFEQHKTVDAEQSWLDARKADPEKAEPYLELAAFYAAQERYPDARDQLQALDKVDPKNAKARRIRELLAQVEPGQAASKP